MAMRSGSFQNVLPYFAAQVLGAMAGATLLWLHYFPHWKETEDKVLKLRCFCTGPAIRSALPNFLSEVIATFVLVFVAGAIFSKAVAPGGLASGLAPYLVGSLVWGVGLSLGGTTGYAINPARDFGPRLTHAILPIAGKGDSDWSYATIPIVGPLTGGALAGIALRSLGI
jgi:glycerol uptake facilitator protein